MPTYERWKYCGVLSCHEIACAECNCGEPHPYEQAWAITPYNLTDHPKFVCEEHLDQYEK